jgi:Fe-S oxidoreductase
MPRLTEESKATRAWACYDCGKCTATCPIGRAGGDYSPRRQVLAAKSSALAGEAPAAGAVFTCLTCSLCDRRCPASVSYTDLVRNLREAAFREGAEPECPHGGALQSVMRMMAKGGTRQDRLAWLDEDLRTQSSAGKVFYWTGCTMYFDAFFPDLGLSTLNGTRAAVRLMNRLGIEPVVSPGERCCGHDLLWNGDRGSFELLAKHNVRLVAGSGAETLVASCAECVRTWKLDYAPFFDGKAPRILHVAEFLLERLPELQLRADGEKRVTYQDPCRLGRHLGIYEAPRQVLRALPGVSLAEMPRSGPGAICCAGGTWSHCDRIAKTIQVERLREARATGATVLVTACPKCQVHYRCAMKDPVLAEEIRMEMRDVAQLVADALE